MKQTSMSLHARVLIMAAMFLVVVAFTPDVMAEEYTVTWTNPTAYDDGSPLDPANDMQSVELFCDGATSPSYTVTGPFAATTDYTMTGLSPGDHNCYGVVVDIAGARSIDSAMIMFNVPPRRPNPIIWRTGVGSVGGGVP